MTMRPGPKAELEGSGYVGLVVRCEHRNLPTRILDIAGKAKTRTSKDVRVYGDVVLSSALWKELLIHFPMSEFQPNLTLSR